MRTRLQHLLSRLAAGRATARDLAAECGVSVRTLHRDIEDLRACGHRIGGARGRDGGFWLMAASAPVPVVLSHDQIRLCALAMAALGPDAGAEAVTTTLLAGLPAAHAHQLSELLASVETGPRSVLAVMDPKVMGDIEAAVAGRRQLWVRYRRSDGRGHIGRIMEPSGLELRGQRAYLKALDRTTLTDRRLALSAVLETKVSASPFAGPGRPGEVSMHAWSNAVMRRCRRAMLRDIHPAEAP